MTKLENRILNMLPLRESTLALLLDDVAPLEFRRAMSMLGANGKIARREHDGVTFVVRRRFEKTAPLQPEHEQGRVLGQPWSRGARHAA